ncbi:hypothetical protein PLUTE_a1016 [Pseudoalteromonas luteoviolacea DSM 6061]|nr:hypothetical protein [Pseudoalteromonas luteoviolacea DSM 6061]
MAFIILTLCIVPYLTSSYSDRASQCFDEKKLYLPAHFGKPDFSSL